MPFTPKRLAQFQAAAAETSHYTVPADTLAVVKNIVVANTATVDVSLSLSIVPAGGVAGLQNRIVPGLVIPPLSVVPLDVTQVMAVGDFISAIASLASSLTVTISGMEDPGSNGLSAGTVIGDPPVWGSPVATGNANAPGVATSLARADHVHKGILAADQIVSDYAARKYRNAAYNIPAGFSVIPLDTIDYDRNGCFSGSDYVVQMAGLYAVTGRITAGLNNNPQEFVAVLQKNPGGLTWDGSGGWDRGGGTGQFQRVLVHEEIQCNVGDSIQLCAWNNGGNVMAARVGVSWVTLTCRRVGSRIT